MVDTNLYVRLGQPKSLSVGASQQRRILNFVRGLRRLERRFFQALGIYYFSRGGKDICQNAVFILSRVLSARFNLPVSRKLPRETDHLEIAIGISTFAGLDKSAHQTFLKVFMAGQSFYLDPTLLFLREGEKAILFRHYPSGNFDQELSHELKIEPYRPDHRAYRQAKILAHQFADVAERQRYVELALDLLHEPRLIMERDGMRIGFSIEEWQRMDAVIRYLEPRAALPSLDEAAREAADRFGSWALQLLLPEELFKQDKR